MKGYVAVAVVALLAAGCASTQAEKDKVYLDAAAKVQIFDAEQSKGLQYARMLNEVRGKSCGQWGDPAWEAAREDLKLNAARMGGDAVINVTCQEGTRSALSTCTNRITCRGDAVKLAK